METKSDKYDKEKSENRGKVYILDRDKDINEDGRITKEDVTWEYLEGDGDFRSEEVQKYLEEADMIITNPPFSLFREFIKWIMDAKKEFIVIGNFNAITYKEIFPLIKDKKIWLGNEFNANVYFNVPEDFEYSEKYKFDKEQKNKKVCLVSSICWFTNVPHGKKIRRLYLYEI